MPSSALSFLLPAMLILLLAQHLSRTCVSGKADICLSNRLVLPHRFQRSIEFGWKRRFNFDNLAAMGMSEPQPACVESLASQKDLVLFVGQIRDYIVQAEELSASSD